MKDGTNNRMQVKEDLGSVVVEVLLRVGAPLIPICLDWKTRGCSVTLLHCSHTGLHGAVRRTCEREARDSRGIVALG